MPEKEQRQIDTARLAEQIVQAARGNPTEEDLKMRAEPILQRAFKAIGIDVGLVGYERGHALKGRSDAVYGFLIIEYERPGKLATKPGLKSALGDLQRNLTGEAESHSPKAKEGFLEKAIGVALDGEQIAFVRYTRRARSIVLPLPVRPDQPELFSEPHPAAGFQVLGPYPVTTESIANFLIYARATARKPLSAEALAGTFGPGCAVAQQAVAELYSSLMRAQRASAPSRVKTFFKEWDRIFGVVYGLETEKAEKAVGQTASLYQMPSGVRLKNLLFSIHTYYAFIMKLISIELLAMQREQTVESFVEGLGAAVDAEFKERLVHLESGADFHSKGIDNFLEADFFSWYLDEWNPALVGAMRGIVRALAEFEPATPVLEPDWTRDLLQKLYEGIMPRDLRHGLGEYYTPDWLAEYLVDRSGYSGKPEERFLDPACGSGTFLVQAIHRVQRGFGSRKRQELERIGKAILENVVGFDLNPLAVLTARTNYLIAFARFIPYVRPISLPVYLCDSVVPPATTPEGELALDRTILFHTTKADYVFPVSFQEKGNIDAFTGMVDEALNAGLEEEAFARRIRKEFKVADREAELLVEIYRKIRALAKANENGIWAKYIKNGFAPVYVGRFDYVVGNPPWIRWGYLSDEYRARTLSLWHEYGLFSLKGHETRLGAGEKDFSMLFTYACADRYLKDGGVLAFLITLEVFKSKGAGEGFRAFQLKPTGVPLKIECMEDLVHLQPFQAANKTSLFVMRRGVPTVYPVPVSQWRRKKGVGPIPAEWPVPKVLESTVRVVQQATPVNPESPVSSWQTASRMTFKRSAALKGSNPYLARLGARVEPYGVFWLKLREVRPDGKLVVENMPGRGKREIGGSGPTTIEDRLVFPAISGGQLQRFGIREPFYVLMPQDPHKRAPYPSDWMADNAPLALGYLNRFKDILLTRGSRAVREFAEATEFYAMYGIGDYTFARYRVTWKRMASRMQAAVLSGYKTPFGVKPLISTDTTSLIPTGDEDEAHYICAILNSRAVDEFIRSFSAAGRGFGAPSVMKNLGIPRFNKKLAIHRQLAEISLEAHGLVAKGKDASGVDERLEKAVKALWNIKS